MKTSRSRTSRLISLIAAIGAALAVMVVVSSRRIITFTLDEMPPTAVARVQARPQPSEVSDPRPATGAAVEPAAHSGNVAAPTRFDNAFATGAARGTGHTPQLPRVAKLLLFDTALGRLSNQLVTITAAMALAAQLGRVAVLPPLLLGGGRGGGGSHVVPLPDAMGLRWAARAAVVAPLAVNGIAPMLKMYCAGNDTFDGGWDTDAIMTSAAKLDLIASGVSAPKAPMCFVLESDLGPALATAIGRDGNNKGTTGDANAADIRFDTACLRMKGVQQSPSSRRGRPSFRCSTTHVVESKKRLSDVLGAADAARDAPILYAPQLMYAADALERRGVVRAWGALAPHAGLDAPLRDRLAHLRSVSASVSEPRGDAAAAVVVGMHLRFLEGSCRDRVQQVLRDAPLLSGAAAPAGAGAALQVHCSMTARAALEAANRSQVRQLDSLIFFVADDGQSPGARDALVGALKAAGVRAVWASRALPQAAAAGWLATGGPVAEATAAMLLDFWTLVEADVFVGNQLSTLSVNVCRRRLAKGRACDNFVRVDAAAVGFHSGQ